MVKGRNRLLDGLVSAIQYAIHSHYRSLFIPAKVTIHGGMCDQVTCMHLTKRAIRISRIAITLYVGHWQKNELRDKIRFISMHLTRLEKWNVNKHWRH